MAYDEIYTLRKKLRQMEDAMMKMEKCNLLKDQYHVIVMEHQRSGFTVFEN